MGSGAKIKGDRRESKSAMCYLWMGIIFFMESNLTAFTGENSYGQECSMRWQ